MVERIKSNLTLLMLIISLLALSVFASTQKVVDKTVATVNDGVNTELITYSDLLWQMSLQPGVALDSPSSEDLNRALQILINIRIFALEAERIPRAAPTEAEINAEISRVLALFPSTAEFEKRLRAVGFSSVKDDNFERLMEQRVAIEKYREFRFSSFIVITPEDQATYYSETYVPDFRRRYPGVVPPTLDEKRDEITNLLTVNREAAGIEAFLDEAKRRVEIIFLSEV